MKKSILTFAVFAFFSATSMMAQTTSQDVKFALCNTTNGMVKQADFASCTTLIPLNKNVTVTSFTVSVFVPDATNAAGGAYVDYQNTGNKLSAEAMAAIKKIAPNDAKVLVSNIVATDGKAEKKYAGFEMHVK
jgi:hypothetical protein